MAWLFGASIKKPKQEVYVSNETEEGFSYISKGPPPPIPTQLPGGVTNPHVGYPTSTGPGYPTSTGPGYPLYPTIPSAYQPPAPYLAICPQAPPGYQPPPLHPLDSVPFKLDSSLIPESSVFLRQTQSDLEKIRNALVQVNQRINSPEYTYTFNLEKSVLNEECSTN